MNRAFDELEHVSRRRRRAWARTLAGVLTVIAVTVNGDRVSGDELLSSTKAAFPSGPVLDLDFADPFILPVENGLFAYATNTVRNGRNLNVQVANSHDGLHWSSPVDAMPARPAWAREHDTDIWAPEVILLGSHYLLYFSARHATLGRLGGLTLCVGAAVADQPEGPFLPEPMPLTCGDEAGAIDASPLRDGLDLWLYVKTDGNCCQMPVNIVAQHLTADGLHLMGPPVMLAGPAGLSTWEGDVIEAPEMRRHDGGLFLFFSGNVYSNSRYAIGYAHCSSPAGPCEKAPENPILTSQDGYVGPGGESIFEYQDRSWIAFAGWREAKPRYRAMYILPLNWINGRPTIAPDAVR